MAGSDHAYTPSGKPQIVHFDANRKTVIMGETVTITWKVTGAQRVFLNGDEVPVEGGQKVVIVQEKKFRLEVNSRGLFSQHQVMKITIADPECSDIIYAPGAVKENEPLYFEFTLKNCESWKIEAAYLAGQKQATTVASGRNTEFKPEYRERIPLILEGACSVVIKASNGGNETESRPFIISAEKPDISEFTSDRIVIAEGGTARVTWKVSNARKLMIFPGDLDVTNVNFLNYTVKGQSDVTLTLQARGDFGVTVTKLLILRVAYIGAVKTVLNDYASDQSLYLSWHSAYVEKLTINPGAHPVPATSSRYPLPDSDEKYTELSGVTISGETIVRTFELRSAEIIFFDSAKSAAFAGMKLYLRWRAINARKVVLDHGIGDQTGKEEVAVIMQPGMEKITLTVWGDDNVVTRSILVPLIKGPRIETLKVPLPTLDIKISMRRLVHPRKFALQPNAVNNIRRSTSIRSSKMPLFVRALVLPSVLAAGIPKFRPSRFFRKVTRKSLSLLKTLFQHTISAYQKFIMMLQFTKTFRR